MHNGLSLVKKQKLSNVRLPAVVLVYLWFIVPPIVGVLYLFHVRVAMLFCNQLDGVESAGCFALFDFLMSCECYCSVPPPHGAAGWCWSAMCDCGIS